MFFRMNGWFGIWAMERAKEKCRKIRTWYRDSCVNTWCIIPASSCNSGSASTALASSCESILISVSIHFPFGISILNNPNSNRTSIKSTVIWSSKTTWRTATTHFCTNCITRLRHVIIYSRSSTVGESTVSSTQLWNKCANSSISTGTGIKTMCVNKKSSKNGSFGPTCPPNLVSNKCSSIFCGVPDITVYLSK